jgi:hypothetical protein
MFEKIFGKIPRKILFVGALASAGFAMFLFGPSYMLNIPDNMWYTISSFFFLGIIQTFFFIPLIPEMIERM